MDNLRSLGFGCVSLFSIPFYKVYSLLNDVFELGIHHYDTAPLYSNGFSEKILGEFARNKRSKITITTKFGLGQINDLNIPIPIASSLNSLKKLIKNEKYQRKSLEINISNDILKFRRIDKTEIEQNLFRSLKNLKTDYVDYYLLHEGLPHFLTDEALSFLNDVFRKGIVLNLGIATNANNILNLAELDNSFWKVIQYNSPVGYSLINPEKDFKELTHFQHTIFNDRDVPKEIKLSGETYGYQLAQSAKNNINGKTLFATTQRKHLIKNVNTYLKYL